MVYTKCCTLCLADSKQEQKSTKRDAGGGRGGGGEGGGEGRGGGGERRGVEERGMVEMDAEA